MVMILRLMSLEPSKYFLFDLPDKSTENEKWKDNLDSNQELIIKNFLYLSQEEYDNLGYFDLLFYWCSLSQPRTAKIY